MRSLENRVAVVTGASVGIGKALAIGLAREGSRVILVARDKKNLEETRRLAGPQGAVCALDLSDTAAISSFGKWVRQEYGKVDILWNGASGWLEGPVEKLDERALIAFLDASIRGPLFLTRVLMPLLLAADHAHVINVSADWEFPQLDGLTHFVAAKRALAGMGIALQKEKMGKLRVTNLHPADVASKDFAPTTPASEVIRKTKGAAIPLPELVELVIFLLKLDGLVVHQLDIKPVNQDIGMTFL
jgi:NAD(P)-dependent dehydrogenase (short-subunit alcohol dehydrogenase family)